jgi:hypothetical protein
MVGELIRHWTQGSPRLSSTLVATKRSVVALAFGARRLRFRLSHPWLMRSGRSGALTVAYSGGFVAAVAVARITSREAMQANLDIVADALEQAGIPYFLVPSTARQRHRVGVLESDRRRVREALWQASRTAPLYQASDVAARPRRFRRRPRSDRAPLWFVFRAYHVPGSVVTCGFAHACEVEFWQRRGGTLSSDVSNRVSNVLPADLRPATATPGPSERGYSSFDVFVRSDLADDCEFPIDLVYTWVDDADPAWQAKKAQRIGAGSAAIDEASHHAARFTNRDELRYSLRSAAMYAGFFRKIFVVTDDQVPDWLAAERAGIEIVDHRAIFDDASHLPSFNSNAIESQLHRIPGLSEHFVYMNDDFFFGRHVLASLCFEPNGLPRVFPSTSRLELATAGVGDDQLIRSRQRARDLLATEFGRVVTRKLKHAPYALRRSLLDEMEAKFPDEFRATASHPFRQPTDVPFAAFMFGYYAYLSGRATLSDLRYAYFDLRSRWHVDRLRAPASVLGYETFCLNDTPSGEIDPAVQDRVVHRFLQAVFPVPSPYER